MKTHHELVNWPDYATPEGKIRPAIYATCNAGLCNRLLVLAGCAGAAYPDRVLRLYWPVNGQDGVGCEFNELFENKIQLVTDWDLHWLLDTAHTVSWYNPGQAINLDDPAELIVVRAWCEPPLLTAKLQLKVTWDTDCLPTDADLFLRQLKPVDAIRRKIRQQVSLISDKTVGLHVRYADEICRPLDLAELFAYAENRESVFLATDSLEVQQDFITRFGLKIITQPKEAWTSFSHTWKGHLVAERGSLTGMTEALVDLYTLAMCREIRGGNAEMNSSFTQVARKLAGSLA